jgi:hypothetical protein
MQNIGGSHNGAVPSLRESNVVVGDVESFSKEGKIVGEIAFSVLNGQKPQGIPIAKGATDYMFRPEVWFSTGNQAWKAVGFLVRETPICYQRPQRFSSEGDPGITSPLQHGFVCSKKNAPALMCLSLALP